MPSSIAMLLLVMLVVLAGQARGEPVSLDLRTPLCIAVDKRDLVAVKQLVAAADDVNKACTFTKGDYPLLIAAQKGELDIGELLIAEGADVNMAGFLGYTALLRAGEGLHPDFMELLLKNEADITAKLLKLEGLNFNLGLDALSLTTASYLSKCAFASTAEHKKLDKNYSAILDLLSDHCFDFKRLGGVSMTRLRSENHPTQASLVADKIQKQDANC